MATITSNGTGGGLAADTTSWDGGVVPTEGDKIIIASGDVITIDGVYNWGNDTSSAITVHGTLKASRTVNSELTCKGEIVINGTLDYGTSSDPIPSDINAIILTNDSSSLSNGKWGLTCNISASFFLFGAYKTGYTTLTADIGNGTLSVVDATGWLVGDILGLGAVGDGSNYNHNDTVTITSVNNNTIGFSGTVSYSHVANSYVCNVTRNVQINASNPSYRSYTNNIHNSSTPSRELQNASFYRMGTNNSSLHYGALRFDGKGASSHPYINIKNLVFYETEEYGMDFYNCLARITVDDCVVYGGTRRKNGVYTRSGSIVTFNNMIAMACSTAIVSSWSQGGVGVIVNDSKMIGCSIGLSHSSAQGFIYNHVMFGTCSRAIIFQWGATSRFNFCDFGFTNGSYSATVKYATRGATNALTVPIFTKCNFNTDSDEVIIQSNANDGFEQYIINKNNDNRLQEYYNKFGSIIRDINIFNTSVASVKFSSINSTEQLKYEVQHFVVSGTSLQVTCDMRKDASYNGSTNPLIRIKGSSFDVTQEMSDTNGEFETISLTTPTLSDDEVLTISIETIGTAGSGWFDNLIIAGTVHDIGQILFTGGTEISTVVDITDTSKSVTLINLIPGSDVVILQGGTDIVLASVDQEPTSSFTFVNSTTIVVDIGIIKPGYVTQYIYGYSIEKKGATLPITQTIDRNYE